MTKTLAIFGRHPIPQPGFNGVMSLFEAVEFQRLGYAVDLLLPFADEEELKSFLQKHQIAELNDLPKFGSGFQIEPVFLSRDLSKVYDVVVYQSYDAKDWDGYIRKLRQSAGMLTKNFPKFVTGRSYVSDPNVMNQFRAFDLVGCALRDDFEELQADRETFASIADRVAYVPRGACPTLLHPGKKVARPTIGLDTPVDGDPRAVQHYVEALKIVKARVPELRVLSLGAAVDLDFAEKVPFGRFDAIYDLYFNEVWIYLVINYEFSPKHLQASVAKAHPDRAWSKKAVYELQNIEAQMSGALLFGHRENLIEELYKPGSTGFNFPDYGDVGDIALRLETLLRNFSTYSPRTRDWAVEQHSWRTCIGHWDAAIRQRLG